MRTLLVGVGNPLLTDDGVGILVAREVKRRFPSVEMTEASVGGIRLVEEIAGYERVVIIDSVRTEKACPGQLHRLSLEDLGNGPPPSFSHGVGLKAAIELGRRLGCPIPEEIEIYAIEVADTTTFHEGCSPQLKAKIPQLAEEIISKSSLFDGGG